MLATLSHNGDGIGTCMGLRELRPNYVPTPRRYANVCTLILVFCRAVPSSRNFMEVKLNPTQRTSGHRTQNTSTRTSCNLMQVRFVGNRLCGYRGFQTPPPYNLGHNPMHSALARAAASKRPPGAYPQPPVLPRVACS